MVDAKKFWDEIAVVENLINEMVRVGFGKAEQAKVLSSFSETFDKYAPNLAFEFGIAPDGVFEMIISAGGIRKNIPELMQLVSAAPKFEKWRIIAFKPRQDLKLHIHVGGHDCDIAKTRVYSKEQDGKFDVALLIDVPADTADTADAVMQQLHFLILDVALGEYDVMTRIGDIQSRPLVVVPQASDLPTISEFVAAFDKRFAGKPQ